MCWDSTTDQRMVRHTDLVGQPTIHTTEVCGERELISGSVLLPASMSGKHISAFVYLVQNSNARTFRLFPSPFSLTKGEEVPLSAFRSVLLGVNHNLQELLY